MTRVAKFAGLTVALVALAIASYGAWVLYVAEWSRRTITTSTAARWWRCRGVTRPLLRDDGTPWRFTYSWKGGMGAGDVVLRIDQNGRATITTRANGDQKDVVTDHYINASGVAGLAAVVDKSGLLCETPELRDGYQIFDLGRYTVDVNAGANHKRVFIDGCYTLPDNYAFGEVARYLKSLENQLRKEAFWGPYGTASVPGKCRE